MAEESISFTIPKNSIQTYEIPLQEGVKIEYLITMQNDDNIEFFIETPNDKLIFGVIDNIFDSSLISETTGTHKFIFDNSISLENSKQLTFDFTIYKVKYDIFIDAIPNSDIQIESIFEDVFDFWKDEYPDLEFNIVNNPQSANLNIQFVKDFGVKHAGYALGSSYMEVGLGDNGCRDKWQPYSEKHVSIIVKHELGHILGLGHSDDPNNIMFPVNKNKEYGIVDEEYVFSPGYGQFIPLCSNRDLTAFNFKIQTDDPEHGFDVYVIPSVESFDDWSEGIPFLHYSGFGCNDKNIQSFFGECHGITGGSSLLIITDKEQSKSLTKINIKTKEIVSEINYPHEVEVYGSTKTNENLVQFDSDTSIIKCGPGTTKINALCMPDPDIEPSSHGGGCLIATATYGSEISEQVQQLRELRDNQLLQTESGLAFVESFNNIYYSFSPIVADYERENSMFKEIVKITITPMITSLSILNHVEMDSEIEVLGYGISLILLNVGMYIGIPVMVIFMLKKKSIRIYEN